jgi:hypothetical protein
MAETTILQAGDTYDVVCDCGWKALDCDDLESAGEVKRLHLGDDHCPDCGAVVTTLDRVCEACEAAAYGGEQ